MCRFLPLVSQATISLTLIAFASGCGGGSNAGGDTTPPITPPSFTLAISPGNITASQGQSAEATISVSDLKSSSPQVTVQVGTLSAGVSMTPTQIAISPGSPQAVVFTASANAPIQSATITLTGTSGSTTHSVQLGLSIIKSVPIVNGAPTRIRYVRTDSATEYSGYLNQNWIVLDPPTQRFFVADPATNRIVVMDANTEKEIGTIQVPGAFGLDETADHSTLYAGTLIGDLYAVNPKSMTVTHRYMASQIGPNGFQASSVRVLANGNLALLGGIGGIPGVDGYSSVGVWNPTNNSLSVYGTQYSSRMGNPGGYNIECGALENIGPFTLTGDRSKIVLASIDSDGTLCIIDPSTGKSLANSIGGFLHHVVATPDGKYLLLTSPSSQNSIDVYDANTLNKVRTFQVSGDTSSAATMLVSADSSTLYITSASILYAYSIATGMQVGWEPNLYVYQIGGGVAGGPFTGPAIQAFDGTGLLAGPMEEGVGFLDSGALRTGAVGTQAVNGYLTPAVGPTSGGTEVQESEPIGGSISGIYFGPHESVNPSFGGSSVSATTPPGTSGPVDLYVFLQDGGIQILPEAFSYGPTVLEATPNASTAEGGGTGILYGYGFGPTAYNSSISPGFQITVRGKPASITGFAYNAYPTDSPPYPLQAVSYAIPSGTEGEADIAVTTPEGSTTVSSGMTYLPAIQQFPLNGAALAQGIYDPTRDLYYFTDASEIRVFSKTQGQWLAPIPVPSLPAGQTHRLWGISLSSDGTKLAVSDAQANAIYVINPDNTGSVQTFSVPAQIRGTTNSPCGLAISNAGIVYYATFTQDGTGFYGYHKLDTNTGTFTDYKIDGPDDGTDAYLRTEISADGTHVFFNNEGQPFTIDTANDAIAYAVDDPSCCYGDYELALSSDQGSLEATGYFYNTNLEANTSIGFNDREVLNIADVYGAKLSPDGRLLFQPTTLGIDVIDGGFGNLLTRIALPVSLSENYDALVSDGKDNVLVAITGTSGNGIAVIDLSSIPDPSPLPYARKSARENSYVSRVGEAAASREIATPGHNQKRATLASRIKHVTRSSLLVLPGH